MDTTAVGSDDGVAVGMSCAVVGFDDGVGVGMSCAVVGAKDGPKLGISVGTTVCEESGALVGVIVGRTQN